MVSTFIQMYKKLGNRNCKDPAQYTHLISFTPSATKPGELHRKNILVIEIGSNFTKYNSRLIKLKRRLNDCSKSILSKNYCNDPMQYTRLIFFTPSANKPGELHWINVLVLEIGSYLTKHNSR